MVMEHNAAAALIGVTTFIIAPEGQAWCCVSANAGPGISGFGDVLTGIMTSLKTRGAPPVQAASRGGVVYALAGQ